MDPAGERGSAVAERGRGGNGAGEGRGILPRHVTRCCLRSRGTVPRARRDRLEPGSGSNRLALRCRISRTDVSVTAGSTLEPRILGRPVPAACVATLGSPSRRWCLFRLPNRRLSQVGVHL